MLFEIASDLFGLLTGVKVCRKSIWLWVQESGQRAMVQLNSQLAALEQGVLPAEEALEAATKVLPLLIGAGGVMTPFRPAAGTPKGKTVWRAVTVSG